MDPVTMSAAIGAGSDLLGGLMGQAARAKELEQQRKLDAIKAGYESQMAGQQNMQKGVNDALARLMQQYASLG